MVGRVGLYQSIYADYEKQAHVLNMIKSKTTTEHEWLQLSFIAILLTTYNKATVKQVDLSYNNLLQKACLSIS